MLGTGSCEVVSLNSSNSLDYSATEIIGKSELADKSSWKETNLF